jgi:hypothetical protein
VAGLHKPWLLTAGALSLMALAASLTAEEIGFEPPLFGLVSGPRRLTFTASPEVASLEVLLDGVAVGALRAPPWALDVDFGALAPHEVSAVARDDRGREIGRARQEVNLPRPLAEAEFSTRVHADGSSTVALHWSSALGERPQAIRVILDGRPRQTGSSHQFRLPKLGPGSHILRAELHFRTNVDAVAETVLGEETPITTAADLSAVAVWAASTPRAGGLAGAIASSGRSLTVVAVEDPGGEIAIVFDESARERLARLVRQYTGVRFSAWSAAPLAKGHFARLVWPWPSPAFSRGRYDVFPWSERFGGEDGGLLAILSRNRPPPDLAGPQRLADAVALAGLSVISPSKKRVVLLVLGPGRDASKASPKESRGYLSKIGVPLVVWSLGPSREESPWGRATPIETTRDLESAMRTLTDLVQRQRIVWVSGRHVPGTLTLTQKATGLTLVR